MSKSDVRQWLVTDDKRQSEGGRVRFGLFEFDPSTGELRRDGTLVRLQPQPAAVLAYLLDRAGEVVTRDALRQTIWGGDTFVDFDRGLNFCIAQIRAALADTADSPRFIRTLPKRGYQFIAPVERLDAAGARRGSLPAPAFAERRATARRLAVAMVVVALTAVGFAGGRWWSRTSSTPSMTIAVARFDNETANPAFDGFTDALTDTVVAQLTASGQGQYQVIGNAAILRRPRDQRDLRAIASSLGVGYIVLGQVQLSGARLRVLAHLIRLPEQTHVWVTRLDRPAGDPLALELEIAQIIASDVSRRLLSDTQRSSSKAAND